VAFKKPPERTPEEWQAFKHWLANPVDAVKEWFKVTPDDWQGDLLNAIFTGNVDRVAGKAAHGPGKTAVDAWAGTIFLNGYQNCRVVCTAPTFAQLHDVLFPEFSKWMGKLPKRMQDEWNISGGHIRHKRAPYDWFAVARTSNKPANLQGFHNSNIFIIADEASAITHPVFEVIEGTLSEAGEEGKIAKLLMAGNPNFNSGELHDAFYRNRDLYERFTITGDPELLGRLGLKQGEYHSEHGRVYYSKRVKAKYVNTIERKYGRDGAVFDVRVRGIFPRAADDAIIPLEWAERATLREQPACDPNADGVTLVVDVSRGGAAESVIGSFRRGACYHLSPHKTSSTIALANLVHDAGLAIKAAGLRLVEVIVDEPGVGGGVIDVLRSMNYSVRGYDGGKPLVKGVDPEEDCRMFANRRARDWWNLRRQLEQDKVPLPDDDVMIAQLASVKFKYNPQEKIIVENKQDLKDRLGPEASPDRGDVIVMGTAPYYDSGAVHGSIELEDVQWGKNRPTTDFGEELADGLL
jgi:hypothetical protein